MASVLVPLAQGCEELEAVTIIDLLVRAGIEVLSAGLEAGPVHCSRGVTILPDTTLDEALQRDFDMVVLPGGLPGADHLDADPRIQVLLKTMAAKGKYTAAICAAPKVLASTRHRLPRHAGETRSGRHHPHGRGGGRRHGLRPHPDRNPPRQRQAQRGRSRPATPVIRRKTAKNISR